MSRLEIPRIVTCSYKAYRREMGTCVRITLGVPRGVRLPDPRYTERSRWLYVAQLAPRRAYFHASDEEFDRLYIEQLDRLADELDQALNALPVENGGIALCCFEQRISSEADCHRRLAAHWLEDRHGVEIPEMDPAPGGCR